MFGYKREGAENYLPIKFVNHTSRRRCYMHFIQPMFDVSLTSTPAAAEGITYGETGGVLWRGIPLWLLEGGRIMEERVT